MDLRFTLGPYLDHLERAWFARIYCSSHWAEAGTAVDDMDGIVTTFPLIASSKTHQQAKQHPDVSCRMSWWHVDVSVS
jgi:hypothetical protein